MLRIFKIAVITFLYSSLSWNIVLPQNLVVNPSFESYNSCPQGPGQFDFASNWQNPWMSVVTDTCSTSDLYNICAPAPLGIAGVGVPNNLLGNQQALSGDGYAGLILYDAFALPIPGSCDNVGTSWREYAEGVLSSPLMAGQTYCVSLNLSLAEDVKFAAGNVGVYFSNTLVNMACNGSGSSVLPFTPQVEYNGPVLTDTSNWMRLEWAYTAIGGEQYFVIGNFKNDANTTTTCVNGNAINPHAYYYLDDVEITKDSCCPVLAIDSLKDVSCNGDTDGYAKASAPGAVAPVNFSWSTGASGAIVSNLPAGNHTVTMTDGRGCVVTTEVRIKEPAVLDVSISTFGNSCGTNVTATPLGGTAPYTYTWSNGLTAASINNLAAGNYTVTIVDANNCFSTESVNVTQTGSFSAATSSAGSSCNTCDGTGTVTPSGGTPPYSYNWSNGATTSSVSNLCPGVYTVTVTESGSGSGSLFWAEDFTNGGAGWTLNLNGPGPNGTDANEWVINTNVDNCAQCPASGSGGNYLHITCSSLTCTLSGDNGSCAYDQGDPFGVFSDPPTDKYCISPNISTVGRTGITLTFWYMSGGDPGIDYGLVRLSDDGGATWTDLSTEYSNVTTCTQATINVPVSYEGIPDFRIAFRWINNSDGDGDDPPFLLDDIELSASGGNSSCEIVSSVNISSTGGPSVSTVSQDDVSCFGENDGAIDIEVNTGVPPYSYSWINGTVTTQDISGLGGGTYTVTVTDGNNCDTTLTYTIDEPQEITFTSNVVQGGCDASGAISITASGGSGGLTYNWSNGETTSSIDSLQAGVYTITISDNTGCEVIDSFTMTATGNFNIVLTPTNTSCDEVENGSISSSVSGGTAPYQYLWNNGDTSANPNDLSSGTYTVILTDDNNCSASESTSVGVDYEMRSTASVTGIRCATDDDGGIKLIPLGGAPPYQYLWNTGDTISTLVNLTDGNYFVTVTDVNGCEYDTAIVLNALSTLNIEAIASSDDCNGEGVGSAQANILTGNAPPYLYNWSTGEITTTIDGLNSGNYDVTVTDSLLCSKIASAQVGNNVILVDDSTVNASCPDVEDGEIYLEILGGKAPFTFIWENGETTRNLLNVGADIYTVVVEDSNECATTDTILVELDPDAICDSLIIYDVFSPNGDGLNDEWIIDGINLFMGNEMQIFNRWGNVVYEAKPYTNGDAWDGYSMKEEPLPSATYYYILKLNDPAETVHAGDITIVR